MKILFAAGGTAGHVNPALAIAQGLQERFPTASIYFAGTDKGMEHRLVEQAGYPFYPIEVRGIQRKITWYNIKRNVQALYYLTSAGHRAQKILDDIKPDLVIGTGGYVSGPILRQAAKKGYKTAIHEQNAYPGVTNKLLAKDVDIIFGPAESAKERLAQPQKTIICGNPVQKAFFVQDRKKEREKLGAKDDELVLLSFGGSLGAMRVNEVVAQLAQWHLKNKHFLHIHATGSIEKDDFANLCKELNIDNNPQFIVQEYINDMPQKLAAADLVICRAGALTLAELAAAGRASILIPSPNVAENHQYYNAMEFVEVGAACVLQEKELTPQRLIDTVEQLTKTPQTVADMGHKAHDLSNNKTVDIIVDALEKLISK